MPIIEVTHGSIPVMLNFCYVQHNCGEIKEALGLAIEFVPAQTPFSVIVGSSSQFSNSGSACFFPIRLFDFNMWVF